MRKARLGGCHVPGLGGHQHLARETFGRLTTGTPSRELITILTCLRKTHTLRGHSFCMLIFYLELPPDRHLSAFWAVSLSHTSHGIPPIWRPSRRCETQRRNISPVSPGKRALTPLFPSAVAWRSGSPTPPRGNRLCEQARCRAWVQELNPLMTR
ncbi:hypothetical protein BDW02DRAFT_404532 [Decorospora gaudefroyi]|uniref:Uncharacterized protein n=1 Tax=Decorospora gaudefroyi TaxID=184978 RepID=A0A6A5KA60_9PLEO|nr:hypothetical protein BDW02DRAFT_404532 [Decorospora gaudefroyi]